MIICFGIHKRESEVCFLLSCSVLEYFSPFITEIDMFYVAYQLYFNLID